MTSARPLSFGALLKRLRGAHNWTQARLAEESHCSTVYISMLERGTRRPTADVVTSLAKALELDGEQEAKLKAAAHLRNTRDVLDDASRAVLSMLSQDASIHTFLIANVRGATRFTLEHGDEAAARLATHFVQVVRETVEKRAGRVFAFRGTEALAIFASPRQALQAAVELQARCAAVRSANPTLPLSIGIGLDAGETVPVADTYHGAALVMAERLCTVSGPGEVLASATVIHLARAIPGLVYQDQGEISLSGTPELVHVMRILTDVEACIEASSDRWTDLLRGTGDGNLPTQLTSFIGRTRELSEVKELLATTRLLTLTGAGGIGKTRLALEAAANCRDQFPGGAWLVELAALTDPQLVTDRTARTLGIRQEAGTPLMQTLVDALRRRRLLIVLDNCEHLLLACAELVETLLQTCPELHILATSRKPLGITGETIWHVPPLSRPEPHPLLLLKDLMQYEAVMLLLGRAQAVVPAFALSGRDVPAVAEICSRLDGMPLVIELAAARIKMLSVGELATRLEDSFHLLTGGSRTALPRQQTLKATLDWSHDLLAPAEQVLFRCLAVFAGTFTLSAVEQVAGVVSGSGMVAEMEDVSAAQVLDLLTGLVDQSVVVVTEDATSHRRYQLLEPIRQYARMQLEASGEASSLGERHAQCFLDFAEATEPHLEAPDQAVWLEQLARDHDNLRTALEWFSARRQTQAGLRLASALRLYWFARGNVREGRDHLSTFLSLSPEENVDDGRGETHTRIPNRAARAKALDSAGFLARYQGDFQAAQDLIRESLAIRRELEDRRGEADALASLGFVILHQGDLAQARALYQESLDISRRIGNEQGIADALSHLGLAAFYEGDYATAQTMHEQTRGMWQDLGDQQGVAWALHCLGRAILAQGDVAVASTKFAESVILARELGLLWGIAWSLDDQARLAARMGSSPEVLRLLGCSTALRRRIGIPLLPQERIELDTLAEAAREVLGPDASAAVWLEGETMPIEQAMDAVLR